jgi:hypothetical protein
MRDAIGAKNGFLINRSDRSLLRISLDRYCECIEHIFLWVDILCYNISKMRNIRPEPISGNKFDLGRKGCKPNLTRFEGPSLCK